MRTAFPAGRGTLLIDCSWKVLTEAAMPGTSVRFTDAAVTGPGRRSVNTWISFSLSVNLTVP